MLITETIILSIIVSITSIVSLWFQERMATKRHRWDLEDRRARHEMTVAEIRDAAAISKSDLEETRRANVNINDLKEVVRNGNEKKEKT